MHWNLSTYLAAALTLGSAWMHSEAYAASITLPAPVEKIFFPHGYDSNDNVQLSLYGNLTHNCMSTSTVNAEVDEDAYVIKIWAKIRDFSSPQLKCKYGLTPFLLNVNIGVLKAGTYTVEMMDQSLKQTLVISNSNSDFPDEFFYAPVTHVTVSNHYEGRAILKVATISGQFPQMLSGCMVLKETKHYISPNNVVVLMPIAEVVEDPVICSKTSLDFSDSVLFDSFQDVGMLHVRVSNGHAQTYLVKYP